ncbi:MAG: hypothetical protein LUQ65_05520, partial [Candidatus Helarchaeota archaeon]|nr:hypothetical protein [Candidatus Helarchaeota archaeon]
VLKLKKSWNYSSSELKGKKIIPLTLGSIGVRLLIMIPANFAVFILMFGGFGYVTPMWGLEGMWVVLAVVIVINMLQGIWDIAISWIIVYPTKIYQFATW